MGFSSTVCYRNELGKILAKLRVDYGESLAKQAARLGFSTAYMSMVASDRRGFSYELYKSIMDHYAGKAAEYKRELITELIKHDVKERFIELFPEATPEHMLYVLYGEK